MSIFHVLYESYLKAEERGQVDAPELDETGRNIVLLPLFHTNFRSGGYDVLQIVLGPDGQAKHVQFIPKDVYTIFPITENSLNRTSNVFAHPLCDDMQYLSKSQNPEKYCHYLKQNQLWLQGMIEKLGHSETEDALELICFIKQIRELVLDNDILEISKDLLCRKYTCKLISDTQVEIEIVTDTDPIKTATKKVDLAKAFITFAKQLIDVGQNDIYVSSSRLLHQKHVEYILGLHTQQQDAFDFCDISGEKMYCTNRNRGLLGKSKLVGVSNHKETYRGRFQDGAEIVRLGSETSEKIHLMLKFLLEHEANTQWLYDNSTAVIWFREDLLNEKRFSLENPTPDEFDKFDYDHKNQEGVDAYESKTLVDLRARKWNDLLIGKDTLTEAVANDFFYLMIINKISNGRLAIQSTRTLPVPVFIENLRKWRDSCRWENYDYTVKRYVDMTPKPWDIIRFIYGVENQKGRVECLKDELKSVAFKRLLPVIIDGMPLPRDMGRQIFSRFKNRKGYKKKNNWLFLRYLTCALLNKARQDKGMERRSTMLNKELQTRDYLYGRLLAIYEKIETEAMTDQFSSNNSTKEGKSLRITNVEKVWSAFFQAPEKMLSVLDEKIKIYMNKLKTNLPGRYVYFTNMIALISTGIREDDSYFPNQALKEDAVFGYYAQIKAFYTRKDENKESKNAE